MIGYEILRFIQHLEAVEVRFTHQSYAHAFAQVIVSLPEGGRYPTGNALRSLIMQHAPDAAWFAAQDAKLAGEVPAMQSLPPELAASVPVENVVVTPAWDKVLSYGEPELRNGQWIRPVIQVDPPAGTPIEELRARLLARIAELRYQAEVAGVMLSGALIKTDRESQATIASAWSVAKQDPGTVIDWKAEGGWVQVDAPTMIAIGDAVFAHVQACFSKECALAGEVEAAQSLADLRAIDIHGVW
ncbi:MAG: DUF4376 domain-containing protein [Thauera sp.]|jgi:hypothetical protein|nr:DUF4376 domain-containing protein [Thauera sp.]